MSFVQRERDKLNELLRNTPLDSAAYQPLYLAQQALAWALEPEGFASPSTVAFRYFGVGSEGAAPREVVPLPATDAPQPSLE